VYQFLITINVTIKKDSVEKPFMKKNIETSK